MERTLSDLILVARRLMQEYSALSKWGDETLAIWLRDSCRCVYCGVDMLQSRQHISNLQHREHLLPACDYPIRQGVRHQHQRRRTIPPVARGE